MKRSIDNLKTSFNVSSAENLKLKVVSVFGVFLVRIFPHLDWIQRNTPSFSVFSPNAGKYGPEKHQIGTLLRNILHTVEIPIPVRSYMCGVFCLREKSRFRRKAHLSWLKSHLESVYISKMKLTLNFKTFKWSLLLLHFQAEW